MNTKNVLGILIIAAATVIAMIPIAIPASADKSSASNGLDGEGRADDNVHDNTGPLSDQDFRFHEGLCQGGHSTDVLDGLGGCDILDPPGDSKDHRQDD